MNTNFKITDFSKANFEKNLLKGYHLAVNQLDLYHFSDEETDGNFSFSELDNIRGLYLEMKPKTHDYSLSISPALSMNHLKIVLTDNKLYIQKMIEPTHLSFKTGLPQSSIVVLCPSDTILAGISPSFYQDFMQGQDYCLTLTSLTQQRVKDLLGSVTCQNNLFHLNFKSIMLSLMLEAANGLRVKAQPNASQRYFEEVVAIFENHLLGGFPPTIVQIAADLNISVSKLKMIFKEVSGLAVYQYYVKRKMEKANEMLAEGRLKVIEVSALMGYSTPTKFIIAYKKHYKQSPKRHFKHMKN
jgi:AraC-like DNA-binding protein